MRHKTKKEIICILDTLQKAQDKVVKLLRKGSYIGEANKVLVECQRCAIQVGESIEKSEGVGTKAVSVLEAYCEYLYLMSENTDRRSLLALKEQMDNALHQVKCEVQENLPTDPLKVVFMPYKASMWDCMESVWEAADVDERCDAYVVPIPFYEKNQQGNTINDCYEGNSFPAYVPITDYRAFSLEEEQPDVIYIHNPFDGANYVTSVHPEYYSSNLKHFTDYLVYIPYYILGKGLLPQTHMNLPAYQYADKIIVQDDEKAESLKDYVPEEKIIVMGSPKVDRLLKLNRKKREIIENEIPEEWRRKIKGKKVILFNVSVSGILKNSKYALDKIQYVISRFENRDDVVLIWRPHPLVEATLKSMRTEMYAKYIKIKKKFVRSGKGILDETGDVGVTVIVSDAYLGENSSSLIHYFGVLGKPVMFIDWKVVKEETEEERRALPVYDFYIENESVFFVPGKVGMEHYLYKLDLKTGDLCVDTKFPGTASYEIKDYLCINKYNENIILTPHYAEDIYVFNVKKNRAVKYVLKQECPFAKFDQTIRYKNSLFLKPKCYPAIVRINLDSYEITEFHTCIKEFENDKPQNAKFVWATATRDNFLYMASLNDSRMLIFDMDSYEFEVKSIGEYNFGFFSMCFDGEFFWLSAWKKGFIIKWEEKTGQCWEFEYYPNASSDIQDLIGADLVDTGEKIFIFQRNFQDIYTLDKSSGIINKLPVSLYRNISTNKLSEVKQTGYWYARLFNKEIMAFSPYDYSLRIFDIQGNEKNIYPCKMNKEGLFDLERRTIEACYVREALPYYINEGSIGISEYIDYAINSDSYFKKEIISYEKNMSYMDGLSGANIHQQIIKSVVEERGYK